MGDIRNFKGIRRAVLNFDYYWVLGKFLCYKVLQVGGVFLLLSLSSSSGSIAKGPRFTRNVKGSLCSEYLLTN